jgi:hypothetical protein
MCRHRSRIEKTNEIMLAGSLPEYRERLIQVDRKI